MILVSWGRNHGPEPDADLTVWAGDFLEPSGAMRQLDGRHPDIQQIVLGADPVALALIRMTADHAITLGKTTTGHDLIVAVGCNHGMHRSVASVEWMADYIRDHHGLPVQVIHRDLEVRP